MLFYMSHIFPEGDPVGHRILTNSQKQMGLWRTTERYIFNSEMCSEIIKEGIGQGGLSDSTRYPQNYGLWLLCQQGASMEY